MCYVLIVVVIGGVLGIIYMVCDNIYLEYVLNYDCIILYECFDNFIEVIYKMEDIFIMECVYCWVVVGYMVLECLFFGWGLGNFVNFYKFFVVISFQIYVSDNLEQLGIYSYFFMILVEQGVLGLFIFLVLFVVFFMCGEYLYYVLVDFFLW